MRSNPLDNLWDALTVALLLGVSWIATTTISDYGVTWDEHTHMRYGRTLLSWFTEGTNDALEYRINYFYGGGFDLLVAYAEQWNLDDPMEAMHWATLTIGLSSLVGTWRLGRRMGGPAAGLAATLMLALNPVYYGHMFNNPKDLPFAAGYIWALFGIVRLLQAFPAPRARDWLILSVAIGSALCVRIAGLLVFGFLALGIGAWGLMWAWQRGRLDAALERLERFFGPALLTCLGAWALMVAPWPWAQLDPIRNPVLALGVMSNFGFHVRQIPFAGEQMLTTDVRWDYLVHYFSMKLPETLLLFSAVAAVLLVVQIRRLNRDDTPGAVRTICGLLLALAIVFPPVYAVWKGSVLYDGLRHFLFIIPPASVAAGCALAACLAYASRWEGKAQWAAIAMAVTTGLAFEDQARTAWALHPHQYVYFNRVAGGLPAAFDNYSTDYYGNSFRETFAALEKHLWETEPQAFMSTHYRIGGCLPARVAREYLDHNLHFVGDTRDPADADFYVSYGRSGCMKRHPDAPIVVTTERQGAPLGLARDLRP